MVRIPSVLTYTSSRSATDSDAALGSLPSFTMQQGRRVDCGNDAEAAETDHQVARCGPGQVLGRLADLSNSSTQFLLTE